VASPAVAAGSERLLEDDLITFRRSAERRGETL